MRTVQCGRYSGNMLKGEEMREIMIFPISFLGPLRHDVLVADYMQNLALTVNGLVVVDCSVEMLNSYIYTESEGKEGGNKFFRYFKSL